MNVLAIGNSFSQDATRYLHGMARAAGVDLTVVNLYIGGCSLSRHFRNRRSGERAYELQVNGERTGFFVSLKEALTNRDWDVVTLQQASQDSTRYETYQPYLGELAAYVRKNVPKAKLFIHETWSYEQGSDRLTQKMGYTHQKEMYEDLHAAYKKAAEDIHADGIIPGGTLFQQLLSAGVPKVHRDSFHASYGLGRYALGLLWLKTLTGVDVSENSFSDFDEPISAEEIKLVKELL